MGGQRKSLLKWSQVPIEPVADSERRIDAGQVPKRIRRAVYRLSIGLASNPHGRPNDTRNDAHAEGQNWRGRLDHQQKGLQL